MNRYMTKKEAMRNFREAWNRAMQAKPALKTDKPAKREAFCVFIDGLHRGGVISDSQAFNWTNPF
jgi:hypothetical protein